ncbi:2-oxoisovalerate dehydrogenase subunit alpha, mitochondrial-like [Varroa destructor]|uniref:2-oxoisovalerate dehydrogenase subunit alpha n=1 Tax=Varroa destructor TaxID=109461 RepID=A0A7M7JLL0_VARDE|nr:2-oxoisovalerate dehydrogenase subunit alpha, mitochondrial-like [Varroa destructor]
MSRLINSALFRCGSKLIQKAIRDNWKVTTTGGLYTTATVQQTEDLASLPFPNIRTKWTEKLEMFNTDNYDPLPVYRVLSPDGTVIDLAHEPKIPDSKLVKMFEGMLTLNVMDHILYESQRQGRISFYITSFGEEATHFGSAAALESNDVVFGQYRETGRKDQNQKGTNTRMCIYNMHHLEKNMVKKYIMSRRHTCVLVCFKYVFCTNTSHKQQVIVNVASRCI